MYLLVETQNHLKMSESPPGGLHSINLAVRDRILALGWIPSQSAVLGQTRKEELCWKLKQGSHPGSLLGP